MSLHIRSITAKSKLIGLRVEMREIIKDNGNFISNIIFGSCQVSTSLKYLEKKYVVKEIEKETFIHKQ